MPSEPMLHEVGRFEPSEAKRILPAFEAAGVPFEVEADHSLLMTPGRTVELTFGMYPPGSKLVVFVPEPSLDRARQIIAEVFPA